MTTLGSYEVHPLADAFPLLDGDEFDELVLDVKRNGLREPIVLSRDGKVLIDGRNRYRACEAAGVDAVFRRLGSFYTDAMILDFIVSVNLARRHLNTGQKAMLALRIESAYAEIAKEAQREAARQTNAKLESAPGKIATLPADLREASESLPVPPLVVQSPPPKQRESATKAAKTVGVSARAVQQAKAVQRDAPDLAVKVREGTMALDAADKQRKQRVKSEPKPEPVKTGTVGLTLYTHDGKAVSYPEPKGKATFNQTKGEGISWAAWSWNPVTGCLHGCNYCYARELATKDSYKPWFPAGFTPLFHHERLDAPTNTTIPGAHAGDPAWRRVFVCSMADLYGRWVPDEWIQQVHASCAANPQWDYLTLTKFPSRYVGLDLPPTAWLGTSVDEQKRVRIAEDAFRQIDGVLVKWLSLEPLLEPLEFTDLSMFDWIVIGAQTETRQPTGSVKAFAPPFEWVARIVAQAREAGCKVHLKPNLLGSVSPQLPGMQMPDEYPDVPAPAVEPDLLDALPAA